MTFLHALHLDPAIRIFLALAFLVSVYVVCRVINFYVARRRTRRIIRRFRTADQQRKSRDVIGDPLIEQIGGLARSADRDNRMRIVYGPWRPHW